MRCQRSSHADPPAWTERPSGNSEALETLLEDFEANHEEPGGRVVEPTGGLLLLGEWGLDLGATANCTPLPKSLHQGTSNVQSASSSGLTRCMGTAPRGWRSSPGAGRAP